MRQRNRTRVCLCAVTFGLSQRLWAVAKLCTEPSRKSAELREPQQVRDLAQGTSSVVNIASCHVDAPCLEHRRECLSVSSKLPVQGAPICAEPAGHLVNGSVVRSEHLVERLAKPVPTPRRSGRGRNLAATNNHLPNPAFNREIAATIHAAKIAGVKPAFGVDRAPGRIRHLEVATHHKIAAHADFAELAWRDRHAGADR